MGYASARRTSHRRGMRRHPRSSLCGSTAPAITKTFSAIGRCGSASEYTGWGGGPTLFRSFNLQTMLTTEQFRLIHARLQKLGRTHLVFVQKAKCLKSRYCTRSYRAIATSSPEIETL